MDSWKSQLKVNGSTAEKNDTIDLFKNQPSAHARSVNSAPVPRKTETKGHCCAPKIIHLANGSTRAVNARVEFLASVTCVQ
jgi:hypothetical protein